MWQLKKLSQLKLYSKLSSNISKCHLVVTFFEYLTFNQKHIFTVWRFIYLVILWFFKFVNLSKCMPWKSTILKSQKIGCPNRNIGFCCKVNLSKCMSWNTTILSSQKIGCPNRNCGFCCFPHLFTIVYIVTTNIQHKNVSSVVVYKFLLMK